MKFTIEYITEVIKFYRDCIRRAKSQGYPSDDLEGYLAKWEWRLERKRKSKPIAYALRVVREKNGRLVWKD